MKRADIIKESDSPYASLMVCVPKPDGQLRVCIDFRMVNQDIVNNAYLMHRIDEQLEAMVGSTVFTTLDLTKGYNQLVLHPESKHVTALSSPDGFIMEGAAARVKTAGAVF